MDATNAPKRSRTLGMGILRAGRNPISPERAFAQRCLFYEWLEEMLMSHDTVNGLENLLAMLEARLAFLKAVGYGN